MVSTCMAALESPPAAQKLVTGSRPRECAHRDAWNARMTPASDADTCLGHARPAAAASESRLLDCGPTAAAAGSTSASVRALLLPRVSAGATLDPGCNPCCVLAPAAAASAGEAQSG